jgi:hypothetical protein
MESGPRGGGLNIPKRRIQRRIRLFPLFSVTRFELPRLRHMILVTGATGNVGSEVVRLLRERGAPVRAFVRDTAKAAEKLGDDVELAVGDFSDAASVQRALLGVDGVFLSSADSPQKVGYETGVIDAAAAAGVRRIVKASTIRAEIGSPLPPFDWHGRIEQHLWRSGIPAVCLQSSFYMTNLLASAEQIRHDGKLFAPAGSGRISMIDPRDSAAVAAVALTADGHGVRRTCSPAPRRSRTSVSPKSCRRRRVARSCSSTFPTRRRGRVSSRPECRSGS